MHQLQKSPICGFTELKKIIGLETNKKYVDADDIKKCLRYSKIMFMTDQDLDAFI